MTITGIEGSRYFLFNPIWVDITDAPTKVMFDVIINGESNFFTLQSFNGKIRFDIGKLVLGLIKNTTNKTHTLLGAVDGAYSVKLKVRTLTAGTPPIFEQIKYFVLGGKKSYSNNVTAPVDLSLTNFAWQGYPRWKSILSNGIVNLEANDFDVITPRVNCNNLFVAFRNNLGGFSFYLFEDYNIIDENSNKGYYLTQNDIKIPGVDAGLSVTVRSKVHRNFYETISHLSDSFEIYIYNENVFDSDDNWIRVNGRNNNFDFNPKNVATDVEMRFDVVTNFNKVW